MSAVAEKPAICTEPLSPDSLGIGDWVWALYWSPFVVGTRDQGSWNASPMRVIAAGPKLVCCDLAGSAMPPSSGDEGGTSGSPLYYALPENLFADRDNALEAGALRKPPAPPEDAGAGHWPV